MARKRKKHRKTSQAKRIFSASAVLFVLLACVAAAYVFEQQWNKPVENAGEQLTAHTTAMNTAQVFMNNRWYAERDMETLLVIGIDDLGAMTDTDSYNNSHQADFLALFLRDQDTGRTAAIQLNRDTMTDITTLGVTGQATGTRRAQLALAYNYGNGDHVSSQNVVNSVEHLLYGMNIDHYLTLTMDAVPILNDWAGGVTVEITDDFSTIDPALVQGEFVKLKGQQALTYVRARKGLDDSSNVYRMERQRQYASEWMKKARSLLSDQQAVADLVLQLSDYYRTDCTAEQLERFAESLGGSSSMEVYKPEGTSVKGDLHMEFHVDEQQLQQLLLNLFYAPVN